MIVAIYKSKELKVLYPKQNFKDSNHFVFEFPYFFSAACEMDREIQSIFLKQFACIDRTSTNGYYICLRDNANY